MKTLYKRTYQSEERWARALTFLLALFCVAGIVVTEAAGRTIFVLLLFFGILALALHYSHDAMDYRSWMKVHKAERKAKNEIGPLE